MTSSQVVGYSEDFFGKPVSQFNIQERIALSYSLRKNIPWISLEKISQTISDNAKNSRSIVWMYLNKPDSSRHFKEDALKEISNLSEYIDVEAGKAQANYVPLSKYYLKAQRPSWTTKKKATEAMDKINKMLGLPLREGFHIMRVYQEKGLWYISRFLE